MTADLERLQRNPLFGSPSEIQEAQPSTSWIKADRASIASLSSTRTTRARLDDVVLDGILNELRS